MTEEKADRLTSLSSDLSNACRELNQRTIMLADHLKKIEQFALGHTLQMRDSQNDIKQDLTQFTEMGKNLERLLSLHEERNKELAELENSTLHSYETIKTIEGRLEQIENREKRLSEAEKRISEYEQRIIHLFNSLNEQETMGKSLALLEKRVYEKQQVTDELCKNLTGLNEKMLTEETELKRGKSSIQQMELEVNNKAEDIKKKEDALAQIKRSLDGQSKEHDALQKTIEKLGRDKFLLQEEIKKSDFDLHKQMSELHQRNEEKTVYLSDCEKKLAEKNFFLVERKRQLLEEKIELRMREGRISELENRLKMNEELLSQAQTRIRGLEAENLELHKNLMRLT